MLFIILILALIPIINVTSTIERKIEEVRLGLWWLILFVVLVFTKYYF